MSNDLISRKALQTSIRREPEIIVDGLHYIREDAVSAKISMAPTAVLVKCGECEHYDPQTQLCSNPMAIGWDALKPNPDDFCSRGEKRKRRNT